MKHTLPNVAPLTFAAPDARQMANAPRSKNTPTDTPTEPTTATDPAPVALETAGDDRDLVITALKAELAAAREQLNAPRAIFGGIVFKPASPTTKSYTEGDRTTKKIANVLIELGAGSNVYVKGSVKAVLNKGAAKPVAEFSFMGSMQGGSCIVAEQHNAAQLLESFKREAKRQFSEWRKSSGPVVAALPKDDDIVLDDISM